MWDRDNRLTQVQLPNGTRNTFAYDANGLRVQKIDSTGTARYVLDGPSVVDELDDAGSVRTSYMNHPQALDEVLSLQLGGSTYYPLTDALGSIYAIADSGGHIVRMSSYDVYGAQTTAGSGPQIAFGFTGRERDADTGLNYNRDRYLNPPAGTWLQADRAGMVDGPSVYGYGRNSPATFSDPSGRFVFLIPYLIVAGAAVAAILAAIFIFGLEDTELFLSGFTYALTFVFTFGLAPLDTLSGTCLKVDQSRAWIYGAGLGMLWLFLAVFAIMNMVPLEGGVVEVFHWGGPITTGTWVQLGPSRFLAWVFSGMLGRWLAGGGSQYFLTSAMHDFIDSAELEWPRGVEFFKAAFGQRLWP